MTSNSMTGQQIVCVFSRNSAQRLQEIAPGHAIRTRRTTAKIRSEAHRDAPRRIETHRGAQRSRETHEDVAKLKALQALRPDFDPLAFFPSRHAY